MYNDSKGEEKGNGEQVEFADRGSSEIAVGQSPSVSLVKCFLGTMNVELLEYNFFTPHRLLTNTDILEYIEDDTKSEKGYSRFRRRWFSKSKCTLDSAVKKAGLLGDALVVENKRLAAENARLAAENARLADENRRLREDHTKEVDILRKRISSLKSENTRMAKEVSGLKNENALMEEEVSSLKSENTRMAKEVSGLKNEMEGMEERMEKRMREMFATISKSKPSQGLKQDQSLQQSSTQFFKAGAAEDDENSGNNTEKKSSMNLQK